MCTHCFDDATPTGEHMNDNTYNQVRQFVKKVNPTTLILSGGEPFEHPNIFKWIKDLRRFTKIIIVTSNGMFLNDSRMKTLVITCAEKCRVLIQITNDPRYYPIKIPEFKHEMFTYENNIRHIVPAGRALLNIPTFEKQNPKCFNYRNHIKNNFNFIETLSIAESRFKFCVPAIDIHGGIRLCESSMGYIVGNVNDDFETLRQNIMNMKCNRCGLFKHLDKNVRQMVGE
jgi:MoaA/NifB/PqqE/SkfB family radical SAM enzyme